MSQVVLQLEGVGKRYATHTSLLRRVSHWFNLAGEEADPFWAVRDVSFTLQKGECVGLIGRNGAGKSTLLKLITGTIRQNEGEIHVVGNVSAILELGLGFHPELTGEQNIYQAGGLLGFSRAELAAVMPDIRAFTELGPFFDMPVRVYSSGMTARLAFALATVRRPEILIVDEVLSVGDAYFQHKSFDRIRQFKAEGTSILLVTHNMGDVRALCDRAMLMHQGHLVRSGAVDDVLDYYNAGGTGSDSDDILQSRRDDNWLQTRSGTSEAEIVGVDIVDPQDGQSLAKVRTGQKVGLRVDIQIRDDVRQLVVGVKLSDRTGHVVWGTNTWYTDQKLSDLRAGGRVAVNLEFECNLGPGSYGVTVALTESQDHIGKNFNWIDNAVVFEVENLDRPIFIGSSWLDARFTIEYQ